MAGYTVSARKYRPDTFKSVVGQEHITSTLRNAIVNDHLAHSFLFTGPRGVGKTTCARILAKTINCQDITEEGEACNECESCRVFNEQKSLNIYELDAASNNSVEDIRNLVDQVRFGPQGGKYKVYIIDEVHMLSQSAFNAFLKTLEEPPPYAIFILATTEKHKILPTILSRCQIFDFNRIQVKDIFGSLSNIAQNEGIEAEDEALHIIAQKADGALRDALSLYDRIVSFSGEQITYQDVIDNLNILDYEYFFQITNFLIDSDIPNCLLTFNEILDKGFDGHNFIVGLSEHLRNLLVCKEPKTIPLLELTEQTQKLYQEQAEKVNASFLLSGLNILNHFDVNYKASKNQRLHTELALMKLAHINDALTINGDENSSKKKLAPDSNGDSKNGVKADNDEENSGENPKSSTVATKAQPTKSPKIGKLDNIKGQVKALSDNQEGQQSSNNGENTSTSNNGQRISPEAFFEAWQEFLETELKGKQFLYNTLANKKPEFKDEHTVELVFENKAAEKAFQDEKMHLNEFLESKFTHPAITIECKVEEPSSEDKKNYLVNPKDKFRAMNEKNPNLKELQERLGLRLND